MVAAAARDRAVVGAPDGAVVTASRWAAATDALLSTLTTAAATTGSTLFGVSVLDGPEVGAPSAALDEIAVGWTFDDDVDTAGSITQSYRTTGGASAFRDEECAIECAVRSWSGGTSLSAPRTRAVALFSAVGDLLRASYDLGLAGVVAVDISGGRVGQRQGEAGSACLVAFTVRVVSII